MFTFDLQRFGGKGGTTIQTSQYIPTAAELLMQSQQLNYVTAIMPNALYLNAAARSILETSMGDSAAYNDLFSFHYEQANTRVQKALDDMNYNIVAARTASEVLNTAPFEIIEANDDWNSKVAPLSKTLKDLIAEYGKDIDSSSAELKTARTDTSESLKALSPKYQTVSSETIAVCKNINNIPNA